MSNPVYSQFDEHVVFRKKPGRDIINDLTPDRADLLHMVVGLVTETDELADNFKTGFTYDPANFIEETGDIFFYTRGAFTTFNSERGEQVAGRGFKYDLNYAHEYLDRIKTNAIQALDAVKSIAFYGKATDEKYCDLYCSLHNVQMYTEAFVKFMGSDTTTVLHENVQKLSVRYPNGYSNNKAISRDDKIGGE